MIRLTVLCGLALAVVAVGLGRMVGTRPQWRRLTPSTQLSLYNFVFGFDDDRIRLLDATTGNVSVMTLGGGDRLDLAASSPWVDERGRRHVVGRWTSRTGAGAERVTLDFGLGRFAFPDGEPLDRISTRTVPSGPPCFFPDTTGRILFASSDGQLYRFAFEGKDPSDEGRDPQPIPLPWADGVPGRDWSLIGDPHWPSDRRFERIVLATVRLNDAENEGPRPPAGIWWLRLDQDAGRIIGAGRLTPEVPGREERLPALGTDDRGGLILSYLSRDVSEDTWRLRLAEVQIDSSQGDPTLQADSIRAVAADCFPLRPTISADGRWVHYVLNPGRSGIQVRRCAIGKGESPALAGAGRPAG